MHCNDVQRQLDEFLDGSLRDIEQAAIAAHLERCAGCRQMHAQAQELLLALQAIPVAPPRTGYDQRVLGFLHKPAAKPVSRHHVPLWFATGFATAMLLVIAVWFMLISPTRLPEQSIAAITLNVVPQQVRKVKLVFNSPNAIQQATMRIELPPDVELEGYTQRRVLEWQTDIKQGSNSLSLPLIARSKADGTLTASISHKGKKRTFQLHIITTGTSSQRIPLDLTV